VSKLSVYYNTPASANTTTNTDANLPPSGKAKRGATTATTAATTNSSKTSSSDAVNASASTSADLTAAVPGTLIAGGHCKGELWGLAVHPSQPQFVTCGDDATLRCVLQNWTLKHMQILASCMHVCACHLSYCADAKQHPDA
jgi:hypothetical protein